MKIGFNQLVNFIIIIIFVTCGIFFAMANLKSAGNLNEPKNHGFQSDEMYFLKTFYEFRDGENIYQALKSADTARGGKMKPNIFMWRWPTVFYLWTFVAKNGIQILYLFWTLAVFSWISVYFILKKYLHSLLAVTGAVFVMIYFSDAVFYKTSFLFTEWWGWFFFMYGLVFFVHKKLKIAWPLFLVAISTRELMIIPIIIFLIISFIVKKNQLFFLSLLILFGIFLLVHNYFIRLTLHTVAVSAGSAGIHLPNKAQVLRMISFSMRGFPFLRYYSHLILLTAALGAFLKIVITQKEEMLYVSFAGISLALILPFISNSYSDYWGITFMPSLLMIIPLLFVKPHEKNI